MQTFLERIKTYNDKQMAEFIIMIIEKSREFPNLILDEKVLEDHIVWLNKQFESED